MSRTQAHYFGDPERKLFAVVDGDPANAHAVLVICPALLHEHFLSYRMLALLCQRLAANGWATLRFDYFGSGDSGGDDGDFSLAGASADTRTAIAWMRERSGAPLLLAGVRGGAWPATACMHLADRLLLWQPLASGADWLADLLRADLAERGDRMRFPLLPELPKPADDDWLLGHHCAAALRNELLSTNWPARATIPVDLADNAESAIDERWTYARHHLLTPAVSGWVDRIEMQNRGFYGSEFTAAIDWVGTTFACGTAP